MNKKKEILFNLNNFLLSINTAFDFVSKNRLGTSDYHSKRMAYISLKFAVEFNYSPEKLFDLCAYSLMHNISLYESKDVDKIYCEKAQTYVSIFPFLTKEDNILKYQHEYYNGSGIFSLKSENIPLFSQFLSFSSLIDSKFDLSSCTVLQRENIITFVKENKNILFSEDICECFIEFTKKQSFWLDLQNENEILNFIFSSLQNFSTVLTYEELLNITTKLSKLIDSKSKLIEIGSCMSDFYKFEYKDKQTFLIAASLSKIGTLKYSKNILEKKSDLSKAEYEEIKSYPYTNKLILNNIMGFADIVMLVSKVQENLNGSGYPNSLKANDLSLKERLLITLIAYDSLRSEKPYRKAYNQEETINILKNKAKKDLMDLSIIIDIENNLD